MLVYCGGRKTRSAEEKRRAFGGADEKRRHKSAARSV